MGARADFPSDSLEELNQLVGARDSIAKQLGEVHARKGCGALAQLSRAESERQELHAYAAFAASSEAEKITEWFVSYLSISLQKDGLQKTVSPVAERGRSAGKALERAQPRFNGSGNGLAAHGSRSRRR